MHLLLTGLLALQPAATGPWPLCTDRVGTPANPVLAEELARRLAPTLSFAVGERFFPTIPFFTAMDGDSTGGDPLKADFEDPWEVAPYLRDGITGQPIDSNHVAWQELLAAYHPGEETGRIVEADHKAKEHALRRVVVLYRVCALLPRQSTNLIRYLKSDEQAYERFQEALPLEDARLLGPDPEFDVMQYFLYYLADKGLQGHPNDVELVSIFFPRNRADLEKFRIVVGSGHSPRTPNNVLVLSAFHRGESRLEDSLFVMVELGGHSSAPDLRPYGRFTPGLDANWHAYDVWGTRDAQAAGGVGYLGRYQQSMTFDRGFGSDAVFVYPPGFQLAQMQSAEQSIKGTVDTAARSAAARDARAPEHHQYRLLPMYLLFQLDTSLAPPGKPEEISAAITAIQRRLCPPRAPGSTWCSGLDSVTWRSTPFSQLAETDRRRAIAAMARWKNDMIVDTTFNQFEPRNYAWPGLPRVIEQLEPTGRQVWRAGTHRPWEHQSFMGECKKGGTCEGRADPTEVFKAHLFRPNTYTVGMDGGLLNLLLLGVKAAPDDGYELYTGIVVPAFRTHGLPVRLGGFLELHAGINCGWNCRKLSPTFAALHEGHRNSIVSWYVTGSWTPRRREVTDDPDVGEFSIGGGASLLPIIKTNTMTVMNVLRIRTGIRFDPLRGDDLLSRVRWELHLAIRQ